MFDKMIMVMFDSKIMWNVILHLRSYYSPIALLCRTAPYSAEIAMLLHCGVT